MSINAPKIRTAETSKMPVIMAIKPESVKSGKQPDKAQRRKEPIVLGGGLSAGVL